MEIERADTMPDGGQLWRDWLKMVAPDNAEEITAVKADRSTYLGYVCLVGRRRAGVQLEEPIVSVPTQYTKTPPTQRLGSTRTARTLTSGRKVGVWRRG